ncbi:MAG: glycoside hydrolase family 2 protein [Bacteroidales bacterium]
MKNFSYLQNPLGRAKTTLNGKWNYLIDLYESGYWNYRGIPKEEMGNPPLSDAYFLNAKPQDKIDRIEFDFDLCPTMNVPGDWNSQVEKLYYYEGSIWFKKSFDYKIRKNGNRLFVHFGAANYRADVYVNGKKAGFHEGGFTPFYFEITDLVREKENFIIVRVDARRKKTNVPALNADWWNYGGITRDVDLIETPSNYIEDYRLQLKKGSNKTIAGYIKMNGDDPEGSEIKLSIPELEIEEKYKVNREGRVEFELNIHNITFWSPENPKLYNVVLTNGDEIIEDKIGFRTIEVKGREILLNGEAQFLRGISIHEENPIRGNRNYCKEDARMMLTWAKELGCNFVRLAHYPHNEYMVRLAEEMGFMIWDEDPVYWNILFNHPPTHQRAVEMMKELVNRDKNRAGVIIWSVANETPVREERNKFLVDLVNVVKSIDDTRLVSAALEVSQVNGNPHHYTIDDPMADVMDIVSFNQYLGWYDGTHAKCSKLKWEIKQDKPVFISECGGGALGGYFADENTRWSEEYQEKLYKETIKMLNKIPQFRGMSPWILADFRSPKRNLTNVQDGWNRKGVVAETGDKKKAFFVLKDFYTNKSNGFKE